MSDFEEVEYDTRWYPDLGQTGTISDVAYASRQHPRQRIGFVAPGQKPRFVVPAGSSPYRRDSA